MIYIYLFIGHNRILKMISEKTSLLRSTSSFGSTDSSSLPNDDSPIDVPEPGTAPHRTYPTRYWILFITCIIMCFHCLQWNTWGPITESVEFAYGWSTGALALLPGWGTIMYLATMAPVCYLAQKYGLRYIMILGTILTTVGLALRCLPLNSELFTIMCHLAAILNGIGTTVVLAVPPMIAADWFAAKERTFAIATMMASYQLGSIASFLEPLWVRSPDSSVTKADIKHDIAMLMYIGAGVSLATLVALIIYYPSSPPTSPSNASDIPRTSFIASIRSLSRNGNFWILLIIYGIALGPAIAWQTTIDESLIPLGLNQDEIMWVGISAVISTVVLSIVCGRLTGMLYGYLKISIIVLLMSAAGCFYWFLLITEGTIETSRWQIYVAISGGVALNYASLTLFLELATEITYPIPEVLIGGILIGADNLSGSIFLLFYLIPDIGFKWVVYTLIASNALVVIPLFYVKEFYNRSNMDRPSLSSS